MSYPINYPTPQGANIQIFYAAGSAAGSPIRITPKDWIKPQGASFVWFTLIGAGGGGWSTGGTGGGSGAVTNFMGPAFLMPDQLRVNVGRGGPSGTNGSDTSVAYQQKDGTGYTLLTAGAGQGNLSNAGGVAMTANAFTAMGFFQSIAGVDGSTSNISPSATTFLSAGTSSSNSVQSNYGYTVPSALAADGYFQMQPIIVGTGGVYSGKGGIGCGGGSQGAGGDGMVVIITW